MRASSHEDKRWQPPARGPRRRARNRLRRRSAVLRRLRKHLARVHVQALEMAADEGAVRRVRDLPVTKRVRDGPLDLLFELVRLVYGAGLVADDDGSAEAQHGPESYRIPPSPLRHHSNSARRASPSPACGPSGSWLAAHAGVFSVHDGLGSLAIARVYVWLLAATSSYPCARRRGQSRIGAGDAPRAAGCSARRRRLRCRTAARGNQDDALNEPVLAAWSPRCTGDASAAGGGRKHRFRAGPGKGVMSVLQLTLRAGLLPRARKPPKRRGAELGANDRDPLGRPLIRPLDLVPSSSRATPTRGSGGPK
jgi:hypothetical protein